MIEIMDIKLQALRVFSFFFCFSLLVSLSTLVFTHWKIHTSLNSKANNKNRKSTTVGMWFKFLFLNEGGSKFKGISSYVTVVDIPTWQFSVRCRIEPKGIKEHLNTWAAWCVCVLSVWYFKCGFILFSSTGVEHCACVLGVSGSSQQSQLAREFKQTIFCLLHLHVRALCPILIELTKPANLTFRVATNWVTNQGTTCTLTYFLRFGDYSRFAVFGCEEKANMITNLNIAP